MIDITTELNSNVTLDIGYTLLTPGAKAPVIAYDSLYETMGIDMFTSEDVYLECTGMTASYKVDKYHPHKSFLPYANIPTGVAFDLPKGTHLSWGGRSGLAMNFGRIAFEGKIDSNYRGEVMLKLWSMSTDDVGLLIPAGTKIAQLVVVQYSAAYRIKEVNTLSETERGAAGFGSTGL